MKKINKNNLCVGDTETLMHKGFDEKTQRFVYALDCDVETQETLQMIESMVKSTFGFLPPRRFRENSNKCLFLFAVTDKQMPKRIMRLENGDLLEFLGKGQHFVAIGTHPSGVKYQWDGGLPTEIPTITDKQWDDLWYAFELILPVAESTQTKVSKDRDLTHGHGKSTDEVADYLDDNWAVYGTGKRGERYIKCPFEHEHSSESNETATAYFPAETGGFERGHFKCQHAHCAHRSDTDFLNAIGFIDNEFDALQEEIEDVADLMEHYLDRYVYIAEGDRVGDLNADPHAYKYKWNEFKNHTANERIVKLNGNKQQSVAVSTEWLQHPKRKSVVGLAYRPGEGRIITEADGRKFLNEFFSRLFPLYKLAS
ncbi:hypothetical protein [Gallibacterium sp. AGMB14963]|uniref:hypothetical protein n=1 Tax=Gallibacterium faecale TaxID=3019086 RepID=UPI0022F16A8D|nr:hypothetical protein [Gallibacterium sp. AGMB14963]MDA3979857.1 hypothetical protein [Gallibacterium sp. AGMB14963]